MGMTHGKAIALRLFTLVCFLIASCVIFTSKPGFQDYSDEFVDKAIDWNNLMYCAIVLTVVGGYNLLIMFVDERSDLWDTILFIDSIICMFVCTSLAIGWSTYAELLQGSVYSDAKWSLVRDIFPHLCNRILISMILSTLGFLANFVIFAKGNIIALDALHVDRLPFN